MGNFGLTYRLNVCYPKLYDFKICSKLHIHENTALSLGFVYVCNKKKFPLQFLLNICKLSCFIGYKCLNIRVATMSYAPNLVVCPKSPSRRVAAENL